MSGRIRVVGELNDGTVLAGHAIYEVSPPHPSEVKREAATAANAGIHVLAIDPDLAERHLRRALELMVDAFLLDRVGNAAMFTAAHLLGRFVESRFGCT